MRRAPPRPLALHLPAAVAAAALAACHGASAGGQKVMLRFHPPPGAAYHYALEQQNSMSFATKGGEVPPQSFSMRMYYTQAIAGPRPGGTGVTVTFDSTAIESPDMTPGAMQPALDRMRGLQTDLVYDDRMHVVSAAFSKLGGAPSPVTEQMSGSLKSMTFPFPDTPVGVGDSWTSESELPLGQQVQASEPIKAKTKLTVKDIRVAGADTSVVLAVETTFPGNPIRLTQHSTEGVAREAMMRLSGGLTGEQEYSLTKSAPVRASMQGTMLIDLQGGTGMTITQQTTLRLTGDH